MKKRKLTYEEKQYLAADNALSEEQMKQIDIFYAASAVVWWRAGWKKQNIMKRFQTSLHIWDECGSFGIKKSMLQIFEEETGIELTLSGYDKSYHDCAFLDPAAWNGKIPSLKYMTEVRRKQKPWVALCIFAGMCLALKRDMNYSDEKLMQYIQDVDQLRIQMGEDAEAYKRMALEVSGIDIDELWNNREAWGE